MASRYRFGLAPLFLLMIPACAMAASGYYLVSSGWLLESDAAKDNPITLLPFIAFTAASPCILMVVLGFLYRIMQWNAPSRREDEPS